jgi:hypothetical protein
MDLSKGSLWRLRIKIPEGRTHGGYLGHRFKDLGGRRSSTLGDFHIEEREV